MIDGIKILNTGIDPEIILQNDLLDFPIHLSGKNPGEILNYKRSVNFRNLIFTLTPDKKVKLIGSLHKYSNNGDHNSDDFTYKKLLRSIIDLRKKFGINPKIAKLNNLEFGVNIIVPFNPNSFIRNLIQYKGTEFNRIKRKNQYYAESLKERYILKIYNKGLQYGLENNILRYEIKVIKSEHLKQFNIASLHDLLKLENLISLGNYLNKSFYDILYYDPGINTKQLNSKERELLMNGKSFIFWDDLKRNQRRTYYNKLKEFRNLIVEHGQYRFFQIPELINEKWKFLLESYPDNLHKLTEFENKISEKQDSQINISNNLLIQTSSNKTEPRLCLVTGVDISMQKENSKFLNISGIRNLYENDFDNYKILQKRLSDKWKNNLLDIQFREIAHSIRNEYFNPINNTRNAIKRINRYPTLFPITEFIDKKKRALVDLIY